MREIRIREWLSWCDTHERTIHVALVRGPQAGWSLSEEAKTTPTRAIRLASAPNFASLHDGTITTIDTTMAHAPMAHHQRGHTNSDPAAARNRSAAMSHSTPRKGETGCVNWGSSANPNASAKPSRWISAWTTSTIAKTTVMSDPMQA
jgi:hypothetical protein